MCWNFVFKAASLYKLEFTTNYFLQEYPMKKVVWITGLVLALIVGYAAAGPYLTVAAIKQGVVDNDSNKLSDNIEFVTLRKNVQKQLNDSIKDFIAEDPEENPFAAIAASLASRYVNSVVDSIVSPAGLAALMQGRQPPAIDRGQNVAPPKKENLFKYGKYSYDSISSFTVSVPNEKGSDARFILHRNGLSWRMVNLIVPVNESP